MNSAGIVKATDTGTLKWLINESLEARPEEDRPLRSITGDLCRRLLLRLHKENITPVAKVIANAISSSKWKSGNALLDCVMAALYTNLADNQPAIRQAVRVYREIDARTMERFIKGPINLRMKRALALRYGVRLGRLLVSAKLWPNVIPAQDLHDLVSKFYLPEAVRNEALKLPVRRFCERGKREYRVFVFATFTPLGDNGTWAARVVGPGLNKFFSNTESALNATQLELTATKAAVEAICWPGRVTIVSLDNRLNKFMNPSESTIHPTAYFERNLEELASQIAALTQGRTLVMRAPTLKEQHSVMLELSWKVESKRRVHEPKEKIAKVAA